jgi:hypothetical protein
MPATRANPVRNLFLGLILANLLYAAWQHWVVPPDASDPFMRSTLREPELVLLRPASPALPEQSAALGDSLVETRCVRLGPFADPRVARAVADGLQADGMTVQTSSKSGEIWVGNWVQVEDLADRPAAERALDRLASRGLNDAYIVSTDPGYKISLGVFRSPERAANVAADADKAGLRATITDRYRTGTEYWLAIRHEAGSPPDLRELAKESTQILRVEPQDCADTGDGEPGPL